MTEDRFEREVRDLLAGRDPGPAPARLRLRIAAVPDDATLVRRFPWLTEVVQLAVAAALIAAVAMLAVGVRTAGPRVGTPVTPVGRAFVEVPGGTFSAAALLAADERLEAVFQTSGLEAGLLIVQESRPATISEPGEPPNRDGDDTRDLFEVLGRDGDGQITCCVSRIGWVVTEALFYWRPQVRTSALIDGFESADQAERDGALAAWVEGIEVLGGGVTRDTARFAEHRLFWLVVAGAGLAVLLLAAFVLIRFGGRETTALADAAALVEAAPPGPVGASVPWSVPAPGRPARIGTRTALAAMLGAAIVGLLPALLSLQTLPLHGLQSPTSTLDGRGFAGAGPDAMSVVLAATAIGGLLLVSTRVRRRAWALPVLLGLVVASMPIAGRIVSGPEFRDGGYALGAGLRQLQTGGPMTLAQTTGAPGGPVLIAFHVTNTGPAPVTIRGLADRGAGPSRFEWIGLGYRFAADGITAVDDEGTHPFEPVRLAPGEALLLVAAGRVGRCSVASDAPENVLPAPPIRLAWDVLGWSRTTEVSPPVTLLVPLDPTCPIPADEFPPVEP